MMQAHGVAFEELVTSDQKAEAVLIEKPVRNIRPEKGAHSAGEIGARIFLLRVRIRIGPKQFGYNLFCQLETQS